MKYAFYSVYIEYNVGECQSNLGAGELDIQNFNFVIMITNMSSQH